MKNRIFHIFAMAVVLMATCISCRQEICYDHYPSMDLSFTWEQEWERDYGMNHYANWDAAVHHYQYGDLRPSVPEWVKMIRYFDDGHTSERFFTPDGARFEVDANEDCSILLYNGDTEYIILSDVASMQNVRASATTRTRANASIQAMQELYQASRTTNPPDVIYSAYVEGSAGVANHEVRYMPVKMQPLVYTYLISFEFEYGMEYVALARGALGGMAEGVYLRTGVTTEEPSIILFDCDVYRDACRSTVRSFGIPGFPDSYFGRSEAEGTASRTPYYLNLEVRMTNGKYKEFNFDISDQIKDQPRGGVIKVSGLRIEDTEGHYGTTNSGFDVNITDWGDREDIDVPIDKPKTID